MKQYEWIEDEVSKMKADGVVWVAMTIHWPIWSIANDHLDT